MAAVTRRADLSDAGNCSYTSPVRRQLRGHHNHHQRGGNVSTRRMVLHSYPRARASRIWKPESRMKSSGDSQSSVGTDSNVPPRSAALSANSALITAIMSHFATKYCSSASSYVSVSSS